MSDYYIAVFDSTHHALKFEKEIKEGGFKLVIMPVPREITASCGISAKLEADEIESIMAFAADRNLKVQGFYHVTSDNGKKTYHKSI